jgi:hypothetical protein
MIKTAIQKCKKYTVYFEKRLEVGRPSNGADGRPAARDVVMLEKMRV